MKRALRRTSLSAFVALAVGSLVGTCTSTSNDAAKTEDSSGGGKTTSGGTGGKAASGKTVSGGNATGGAPAGGPDVDQVVAVPGGPCAYTDDKQFCACLAKNCGGDSLPDKDGVYHSVYCGNCSNGQICVGQPTFAGGAAGACAAIGGLTPAQKKTSEQLTSIWENSTPSIDYAYSRDIRDGRGYTSGRAGFCTGTGDGIVVVACYDAVKPGNTMEKFMPALKSIQDKFVLSNGTKNQGATNTLPGWAATWKAAAADPAFRGCQDAVVDAVYYGAAMQHAAAKKFTTALTKAAFYDAQINNGDDNPEYGMKAMIAAADKVAGALADPPTRADESKWLAAFLKIRAQIMYDDAQTWRANMYRVANYEKLRKDGNFDLTGCVQTGQSSAADMWPGAGFTSDPGDSFKVCN